MEEKIENDEKYYRYIQDGIKKMLQNIGNFFMTLFYDLFMSFLWHTFYDADIKMSALFKSADPFLWPKEAPKLFFFELSYIWRPELRVSMAL